MSLLVGSSRGYGSSATHLPALLEEGTKALETENYDKIQRSFENWSEAATKSEVAAYFNSSLEPLLLRSPYSATAKSYAIFGIILGCSKTGKITPKIQAKLLNLILDESVKTAASAILSMQK